MEWNDPEKGELAVEMWDTAGQEAFEQLRKLSYPGTDIFLVGYCCVQRTSLNNIEHKWLTEINAETNADKQWIIIVGTKCDLRDAVPDGAVSKAEAEAVCQKIDACALIETSAKSKIGISDLTAMMTKMAFMKIEGAPRPSWGTIQSAGGAKVEMKGATKREATDKELAAAPKEKVKRESVEAPPSGGSSTAKATQPAAKHETKPAKQQTGGQPSGRSGGKDTQKNDGPGCSCVIA